MLCSLTVKAGCLLGASGLFEQAGKRKPGCCGIVALETVPQIGLCLAPELLLGADPPQGAEEACLFAPRLEPLLHGVELVARAEMGKGSVLIDGARAVALAHQPLDNLGRAAEVARSSEGVDRHLGHRRVK